MYTTTAGQTVACTENYSVLYSTIRRAQSTERLPVGLSKCKMKWGKTLRLAAQDQTNRGQYID